MTSHNDLVSAFLELARELATCEPFVVDPGNDDCVSTPFSTTSQSDWVEGVRYWNQSGRHLIADLPSRCCPACGLDDHRQLFHSYDGYPYVECVNCGCWYVPLKIEADLFVRFFELCPPAFEVMQRVFHDRRSETSRQSNIERIGGYLDTLIPMLANLDSLNYLDMGCGLGHSLLAARARGLQAVGVESSPECITLARQDDLAVFHIADAGWQGHCFHLVSFWESLEHMAEPVTVLTRIAQRLAPNGLIAFSVPNQNSPLVRAQREDCSFIHGGYDTPGHINLFNPATLELLLDRSGYTLLALDGQYSLNLIELVSYMRGNQHGIYDILQGGPVNCNLSAEVGGMLRSIGPAVTLFERVTLTAPILFGFACRKKDTAYFAQSVCAYKSKRLEGIDARIRELEPASRDIDLLPQRLREANDRIEYLEDQLRLTRNPLRRLVRFVLGKLNSSKG